MRIISYSEHRSYFYRKYGRFPRLAEFLFKADCFLVAYTLAYIESKSRRTF